MKKLVNLKNACAIALSVVLFGSCMKNDNPPPVQEPAAFIALFNAYSPITTSQVVFSNSASGNIPYGQGVRHSGFTDFATLKLTVRNQATNQNLITDAALNMKVDKAYTGVIFGKDIPAKFILLNDSLAENTSNNSNIRFLNLAEGVEAVDVFLGTDRVQTLSNRLPETQANSVTSEKFILSPKAAGPQDIIIKGLDGTTLAELKAFNFGVKEYYTIILQGDKASTGDSAEAKAKALKVSVLQIQ